jgi:lipopolysaccharide O-acetyltransferase
MFYRDCIKNGGHVGTPLIVSGMKFISIGKGVRFYKGCRLQCWSGYGGEFYHPKLTISDGCVCGGGVTFLCTDDLFVGNDTIFAANVLVTTENHGMDPECDLAYMYQPLQSAPVKIGSKCWIGQNAVILPGVEIGDRCIIGANSVVTKSIPSYCIAAGMPAKVIKRYDFEKHVWIRV